MGGDSAAQIACQEDPTENRSPWNGVQDGARELNHAEDGRHARGIAKSIDEFIHHLRVAGKYHARAEHEEENGNRAENQSHPEPGSRHADTVQSHPTRTEPHRILPFWQL